MSENWEPVRTLGNPHERNQDGQQWRDPTWRGDGSQSGRRVEIVEAAVGSQAH